MIKNILNGFFGSVGTVALSGLMFFSFYCSPGWFGFASKEGDVRGWGSLFYGLMFFPTVMIAVFVHSIYVLKGVAVPHKGLYLGAYLVVMLGVGVMNFMYMDKLKIAGALAVVALVFSVVTVACMYLLKVKYAGTA